MRCRALLGLLAAVCPCVGGCCAAANAPAEAVTSVRAELADDRGPPPNATAQTEPRGYQARVVIDTGRAELLASWTDVAVSVGSPRALELCEALTTRQTTALSSVGLAARVTRPCATEPLPPEGSRRGGVVLVSRRLVAEPELLLLALEASSGVGSPGEATVTDFAVFPGLQACERARDELGARRQADRAAAAVAARSWLEGQLDAQEQETSRLCDEQGATQARCAGLGRSDGLERGRCQIDLDRATRACTAARALAEILRGRVATADQPEPDPSPPTCRPDGAP